MLQLREHKCYSPGCLQPAPFICRATVLGKEFGCGERHCTDHMGKFGLLFFQKVQFNDEDVFEDDETLC